MGPFCVTMDMMKAAGDVGTKWMTDVCNSVLNDDKIPEDCRLITECLQRQRGSSDHATLKRVKIDNIKFGLMAGRGTTDKVRLWQEKYLARKKDLWMAFVDMEKAYEKCLWSV